MNEKFRATIALAAVILAGPVGARAGSIWAKASNPRPLHSDDTARRIGDVLTIVIEERSVIGNKTKRELSKESERTAGVSGNLDLLGTIDTLTGKLFSIPDLSLNMDAETTFEGEADYDSDRKMLDQITVTVADVLPNGNLVVVGARDRVVSGDKQTIQVGGVVRPSDITFSNTVRSEQVAEFKIVFKNTGREPRFTKPGWLDRILNILNPF